MLRSYIAAEWEEGLDDVFLLACHGLELSQGDGVNWGRKYRASEIYILHVFVGTETGCRDGKFRLACATILTAKSVRLNKKRTGFHLRDVFKYFAVKDVTWCLRDLLFSVDDKAS